MKKVLLIFLLLILTGCWDKHEIEEQAFVIAIGLDDSDTKNGVSVTYQIANPQVGIPNTGGEKEEASEIITFTAPDFLTARDLANATVARKINFSHTKAIIIGEEFAKKEKFLKYMSSGIRDREIRRDLKMIISKEKASDFIKNNKPKLETRPHKYYDLMAGRWEETGLVPLSDLQGFFHTLESKQDGYLIIYASTEKQEEKKGEEDDYLPGQIDQQGGTTQVIGSAIMKDGILVGLLTGEETRLALNLRKKSIAKYLRVTYPDPLDPQYRIAAMLTKHRKTKVEVKSEERLKITVSIPIDLEILAIPSEQNYVTNKKKQEVLRRSIEENLKKKFNDLIKKSQNDFKINPFNWSDTARRNFLTLQEYEKYNFKEKYLTAEVNIAVDVKLTGFGKQLGSPEHDKPEEN